MKTTSIKVLTATLLLFSQVGCASDSYYYKNSQKVELQPKPFRSSTKIDYYQNSRGIVLGVSDKLILKLKNPQNLKEYLLEFDLKIERSLSENIYLLQVSDKKLTLEISNRLSEKEDVEYAHPDFIKQRKKR